MKRFFAGSLCALLLLTAACGKPANDTATTKAPTNGAQPTTSAAANDFDYDNEIAVTSREEGSGTRGAFVELFGIEQKDANGNKVDYTTLDADITNSTSVMMTSVAGNPFAIGYISLGSLNDTVKAVEIDGAAPSAAAIKTGDYKISRPFNVATKGDVSPAAQDFLSFILSAEGQAVVEKGGYIKVDDGAAFQSSNPTGKVVVAGSSSVTPIMEKLKEAYLAQVSGVTIEVQQSDSTTGMTSVLDGVCDIGMASRALKDSELEKGLTPTAIALDGIAVIVSNDNPTDALTSEQVKNIFTGELTEWSEVK